MTVIQRFEKNTKGNDYVVGDIHGMFGRVLTVVQIQGARVGP